jgi:chemotaxis methyl-accepting protein methylase
VVVALSNASAVVSDLAYRLGFAKVPSSVLSRVEELVERGVFDEAALTWALTIKQTRFFRQPGQYDVLFEFLRCWRGRGNGRVCRIWCAACSTGQEAYSAAAVALAAGVPAKVLGTDVDALGLEAARVGRYREEELEHVPPVYRWCLRRVGGAVEVVEELRELVEFRKLNLASDDFPEADVVFCRNVLIYFRREVVEQVVEKIARCLSPGGLLFLGEGGNVGAAWFGWGF